MSRVVDGNRGVTGILWKWVLSGIVKSSGGKQYIQLKRKDPVKRFWVHANGDKSNCWTIRGLKCMVLVECRNLAKIAWLRIKLRRFISLRTEYVK